MISGPSRCLSMACMIGEFTTYLLITHTHWLLDCGWTWNVDIPCLVQVCHGKKMNQNRVKVEPPPLAGYFFGALCGILDRSDKSQASQDSDTRISDVGGHWSFPLERRSTSTGSGVRLGLGANLRVLCYDNIPRLTGTWVLRSSFQVSREFKYIFHDRKILPDHKNAF